MVPRWQWNKEDFFDRDEEGIAKKNEALAWIVVLLMILAALSV